MLVSRAKTTNIKAAQADAGHSGPEMVLHIYSGLAEEGLEEAAEAAQLKVVW